MTMQQKEKEQEDLVLQTNKILCDRSNVLKLEEKNLKKFFSLENQRLQEKYT